MDCKYNLKIAKAVELFWRTKKKQGNVLAGKQVRFILGFA